jgi:hypothetical protein
MLISPNNPKVAVNVAAALNPAPADETVIRLRPAWPRGRRHGHQESIAISQKRRFLRQP